MAPRLLISNQSVLVFSFKAPSPQTKAPQTTVAEQESHDEVFGKEAASVDVRYMLVHVLPVSVALEQGKKVHCSHLSHTCWPAGIGFRQRCIYGQSDITNLGMKRAEGNISLWNIEVFLPKITYGHFLLVDQVYYWSKCRFFFYYAMLLSFYCHSSSVPSFLWHLRSLCNTTDEQVMALAVATWGFFWEKLKLAGVLIFKLEMKPFLPLMVEISL